ncbi:hypothetical protein [Streptococcus oricebi]|uniref:Uncharacterized protein n=1 Tax=Streptococcus oricebi TaxID=1547447 RepID=A0ABS5B4T4_9STRE|nr:hypothetical protein [Streptococcus oricebi]MBP2623830.1 hypothetical protein [Streptococcus oricebi]
MFKQTAYQVNKKMVSESFQDFKEEGFTSSQALAAALEDCAIFMRKSETNFAGATIALSLIGLDNGLFPDYLEYLLKKVDVPSLSSDIKKDMDKVNIMLEVADFSVEEDLKYLERIKLIFDK